MRRIYSRWLAIDVVCVFLAANLPLDIFLKHSSYNLWAPEILAIKGMIFLFAIAVGAVIFVSGAFARVAVFTALAVLTVDIQTDWITTVGLRLGVNVLGFGLLFWLVRRHLSRVLLTALLLMSVATFFQTGGVQLTREGEPGPQPDDDQSLPFVLHLILDEQIGVEGIPSEFDPGGEVAAKVREFYLGQSFAVFGRAYSHYGSTAQSIPNILNGAASNIVDVFLDRPYERNILLDQNRWFEMLREKGYRIHAMESNFMRYVGPPSVRHPQDTSLYYLAATIKPLESAPMTAVEKIPFILSTYYSSSWLLSLAAAEYTDFALSEANRIFLPQWDLNGHYPGALATLEALDVFTQQMQHAGPGQAYFAHILMPHSPYGYDSDCQMEMQPGRWLGNKGFHLGERTNDASTRAERYPLYFGQMLCLQSRLGAIFQILRDKGLWEDAIVVVHGDHGSRLSEWPPIPSLVGKYSDSDYMDYFSTMFAVKSPVFAPQYEREIVPVDQLFSRLLQEGAAPKEDQPWVFFQGSDRVMKRYPMPGFGHGRPQSRH